jgi:hypothetical protein
VPSLLGETLQTSCLLYHPTLESVQKVPCPLICDSVSPSTPTVEVIKKIESACVLFSKHLKMELLTHSSTSTDGEPFVCSVLGWALGAKVLEVSFPGPGKLVALVG